MNTSSISFLLRRTKSIHEAHSFFHLVCSCRPLSSDSTLKMAVKLSSSHKALESPFSHVSMYGRDHPASSKVTADTEEPERRQKVKAGGVRAASNRLSRASAKSFSTTSPRRSSALSTATSGGTGKQKKGSPKASKQTRNGSGRNGNVPRTTPTSERSPVGGIVQVDHDSPVLRSGRSGRAHQFQHRNGTWKHSKGLGKKSSLNPSKAAAKPSLSSASSNSAVTSKSLLAQSTSTMSTSEVLLSFSRGLKKSGNVDCSANVQLKKTTVNVHLPPHMHLPRRAFGDGDGGKAVKGSSKGKPLTIDDIGMGLGKMQYRNVIVMSGAGVSTTSGIPDFRTPGTGLYDNLQQYKIPDPTAIFDITFFVHNPKPFLALARELYPGRYQPNTVHHFVRLLQEKGVLLRNYTQNIDGLERLAGLKPGKLVEAHGSFSTASCIICKTKQDPQVVKSMIFSGQTPRCKHKYCYGLVKPDIVFFGEDLPQRFHSLQLPDFAKCDLLIVMGTSLEVEPFASLAALPRITVPRLLINRELVGPFKHRRKRSTDLAMTGDLVECVSELAAMAGWEKELETLVKGIKSEPSEEGLVPPSSDLHLQSTSSSTAASPLPFPHDEGTRGGRVASEDDITTSLSGLSLMDEPGVGGASREVEHVGDGGSEQGEGEGDCDSREKRTRLTTITEAKGEEEKLDSEQLEWRVSDVFSGLDKDAPKTK